MYASTSIRRATDMRKQKRKVYMRCDVRCAFGFVAAYTIICLASISIGVYLHLRVHATNTDSSKIWSSTICHQLLRYVCACTAECMHIKPSVPCQQKEMCVRSRVSAVWRRKISCIERNCCVEQWIHTYASWSQASREPLICEDVGYSRSCLKCSMMLSVYLSTTCMEKMLWFSVCQMLYIEIHIPKAIWLRLAQVLLYCVFLSVQQI